MLGFILGLVVGVPFGWFILALFILSREGGRRNER